MKISQVFLLGLDAQPNFDERLLFAWRLALSSDDPETKNSATAWLLLMIIGLIDIDYDLSRFPTIESASAEVARLIDHHPAAHDRLRAFVPAEILSHLVPN